MTTRPRKTAKNIACETMTMRMRIVSTKMVRTIDCKQFRPLRDGAAGFSHGRRYDFSSLGAPVSPTRLGAHPGSAPGKGPARERLARAARYSRHSARVFQ